MKSSEVSIKARSTPASLTIQGHVTKDTTVKWSVNFHCGLCAKECHHSRREADACLNDPSYMYQWVPPSVKMIALDKQFYCQIIEYEIHVQV